MIKLEVTYLPYTGRSNKVYVFLMIECTLFEGINTDNTRIFNTHPHHFASSVDLYPRQCFNNLRISNFFLAALDSQEAAEETLSAVIKQIEQQYENYLSQIGNQIEPKIHFQVINDYEKALEKLRQHS